MEGRMDSSVTISLRNFVGEGIIKILYETNFAIVLTMGQDAQMAIIITSLAPQSALHCSWGQK
jgi:hypothetical protein